MAALRSIALGTECSPADHARSFRLAMRVCVAACIDHEVAAGGTRFQVGSHRLGAVRAGFFVHVDSPVQKGCCYPISSYFQPATGLSVLITALKGDAPCTSGSATVTSCDSMVVPSLARKCTRILAGCPTFPLRLTTPPLTDASLGVWVSVTFSSMNASASFAVRTASSLFFHSVCTAG